ncbi:ABC-2 type transport system permease protein [Marinococcus luteus]|uniref:ABC-2 type transport system permease protein n=1 Tax=Marinococcus luteus TaxID=1122204 RepID=A0A1H2UM84_9BACI|nr:ABC transporter permease [Marinococcus luteus]SDW57225.1 ABC-2 type transport system permease protein [Marinococcus luteus]
MIRLIQNEWMKLFWRISTWVMAAILLVGVIGVLIYSITNQPSAEQLPSEAQWKAQLEQENAEYQQALEESGSSAEFYEQRIAENEYRIQNDIPPQQATGENVWSFMSTNTALLDLLSIFVIIIAATIISSEFKSGTIKLLLVRPPSRIKILFSKYLTVLLYALGMLAFLFGVSFILGALFFGFGESSAELIYTDGEVEQRPQVLALAIDYLTGSVNFVMLATLAFAISAIFRSEAMAIAISVLLYVVGAGVTSTLAMAYDWPKFLLFANTNLNQYFTSGGPPVESMTLGFSVIVLIVYWLIFMGFAVWMFKKREISVTG